MKKQFPILLTLALAFCLQTEVKAQFPRVDIPGSHSRKIYSQVVGQEYELQILLPGSHSGSSKKYPVVYLMDSQWDFPLLKSIYGQHYYDGFIPELIIVGITWAGERPNADSLRARDYTPTKENSRIQSGGADRFLSFMKTELFPFIESNYKADPANRSLMGCSLGGLITLYALFTQPELFNGYAAASPAIGWDREVLYKYEEKFAEQPLTHPVRVYMTIGDVERSRPAYEKFANRLIGRQYPAISVHSKILENTGHSGTKSETYSRGLQYIFERPKLKLKSDLLDKYAGVYTISAGYTIELKQENGSLVLYYSGNNRYPLDAASETGFYSTAEFLNIQFNITDNKLTGFQLNRYGSSQFVKKRD